MKESRSILNDGVIEGLLSFHHPGFLIKDYRTYVELHS